MARDDNWQARQAASVARYGDSEYNADPVPLRIFGGFIAVTLTDRSAKVLDIGCGISPNLPQYVDELGLTDYTGLDPLRAPSREYPFIEGVAEALPFEDASVDVILFPTSFDHIADETKAIAETKRVLKPNGRVYMWQGISDPDVLATGATHWRLTRGVHAIPLVTLQAAKTWARMKKRERDLAAGARLDNAHERWFTRAGLREAFKRSGFAIVRELEPYGMASMFIEARRPGPHLFRERRRDRPARSFRHR